MFSPNWQQIMLQCAIFIWFYCKNMFWSLRFAEQKSEKCVVSTYVRCPLSFLHFPNRKQQKYSFLQRIEPSAQFYESKSSYFCSVSSEIKCYCVLVTFRYYHARFFLFRSAYRFCKYNITQKLYELFKQQILLGSIHITQNIVFCFFQE